MNAVCVPVIKSILLANTVLTLSDRQFIHNCIPASLNSYSFMLALASYVFQRFTHTRTKTMKMLGYEANVYCILYYMNLRLNCHL